MPRYLVISYNIYRKKPIFDYVEAEDEEKAREIVVYSRAQNIHDGPVALTIDDLREHALVLEGLDDGSLPRDYKQLHRLIVTGEMS